MFGFFKKKQEVRRALDPETGEPIPMHIPSRQILQGYMTKIGLVIGAIGAVGKVFGVEVPATELNSILDILMSNYDDIALLVGALTAAYGKIRRNWRETP